MSICGASSRVVRVRVQCTHCAPNLVVLSHAARSCYSVEVMRGELTTAVPALIDTFSLQSALCLLAGKTRTICYFPRTLCSVCLPAGSVVSMCGVQSPPPPFAKIQTGGDLTRRQLDVSRQDEIDSFSGNGHPTGPLPISDWPFCQPTSD